MSTRRKPKPVRFHRSLHSREEAEAVARVLRSGRTGGGGKVSRRVESMIRRWTGGARVLLAPSGSAALEMAFQALRLLPGDEVILPSFAFVSAANAILRAGGRPVFAEVEEESLNLSPDDVRRRLSNRTRAVLPVHYGGRPCRMDEFLAMGRQKGVAIVEDAAHAYGGRWQGKPLGGIGDLGVYSFHETKSFSCGEGGALTIRSKSLVQRAEVIQEKGTDRTKFLRGDVGQYVWRDIGSSYLLGDVLAAILEIQIRDVQPQIRRRRRWWQMYRDELLPLAESGRIVLPLPLDEARSACHIFHLQVRPARDRNRVLRALSRAGIESSFHFVPLHSSPFGRRVLGARRGDLPVTERVARSLIRLPLHPLLRESEVKRTIRAVRRAVG